MAKPGQSIEAPIKGERIVWRTTGEETGGATVIFDQYIQPGGGYTGDHIHILQVERNEVISGVATYSINGVTKTARVGEHIDIPLKTIHQNPYNASDATQELHLLREITPEMGIEIFFETTYGLARDGKVDKYGNVNPIQMAVLGNDLHNQTYFFPKLVPYWIQNIFVPLVAFIGHLLGMRARYDKYSGPETPTQSTSSKP
jgi:hypothetical protein